MLALSFLGAAWRPFSRSRPLARAIFGVDFGDVGRDRYFDVTTPLLVKAAARRLNKDGRFLDMGTGPFATIGLGVWRKVGCTVVSTDVQPDVLERAKGAVERNHAPIRVLLSRFWENVRDERFDVVAFNPPYVPTAIAQQPSYQRSFNSQSDGGPDGTDLIHAFVDAFAKDGGEATGLVAVNGMLTPPAPVLAQIRARGDVDVTAVEQPPLFPFLVLALRRKTPT
jgi:methylase of polypeptide subunit release factors